MRCLCWSACLPFCKGLQDVIPLHGPVWNATFLSARCCSVFRAMTPSRCARWYSRTDAVFPMGSIPFSYMYRKRTENMHPFGRHWRWTMGRSLLLFLSRSLQRVRRNGPGALLAVVPGRRGRQPAGRSDERPSTQSRHVLLIGALVACVLWLLPPLDTLLAPAPSLESLLPLTHRRKQAPLDAAPQAAARAADIAPRRELQSGPVDSGFSPQPPVALAVAAPPQHPTADLAGRAAPPRDLVFGVVAFRPDSGCTQSKHAGKQCDRSPYYKGLRRCCSRDG